MKEDMKAIKQRLDQMQGQLLAQELFLLAVAQDLHGKDWSFLLGTDGLIETRTHQLRHSGVSDLTLHIFQQRLGELFAAAQTNSSNLFSTAA